MAIASACAACSEKPGGRSALTLLGGLRGRHVEGGRAVCVGLHVQRLETRAAPARARLDAAARPRARGRARTVREPPRPATRAGARRQAHLQIDGLIARRRAERDRARAAREAGQIGRQLIRGVRREQDREAAVEIRRGRRAKRVAGADDDRNARQRGPGARDAPLDAAARRPALARGRALRAEGHGEHRGRGQRGGHARALGRCHHATRIAERSVASLRQNHDRRASLRLALASRLEAHAPRRSCSSAGPSAAGRPGTHGRGGRRSARSALRCAS